MGYGSLHFHHFYHGKIMSLSIDNSLLFVDGVRRRSDFYIDPLEPTPPPNSILRQCMNLEITIIRIQPTNCYSIRKGKIHPFNDVLASTLWHFSFDMNGSLKP